MSMEKSLTATSNEMECQFDAMWNQAGLWSSGQFTGNLRGIFDPENRVEFAFFGEDKLSARAAWVFSYAVGQQYEPEWVLRAEGRLAAPPYGGKLWIDKQNGNVLRLEVSATDLPRAFAIRQAEVTTEYENVRFPDGTSFVLPVRSSVISRYKQKLTKNVVEFRDCQKFRATTRMLVDLSGSRSGSAEETEVTSPDLEMELGENEVIYSIAREDAMEENDIRLKVEQEEDLKIATGEAFFKLAELEKQRQQVIEAEARKEKAEAGYELVTDAKGNTTMRVLVRLVPVTVVVRDSKGHTVGDLTKDDFVILDNGKSQEIVNFSVEKGAHDGSKATGATAGKSPRAYRTTSRLYSMISILHRKTL